MRGKVVWPSSYRIFHLLPLLLFELVHSKTLNVISSVDRDGTQQAQYDAQQERASLFFRVAGEWNHRRGGRGGGRARVGKVSHHIVHFEGKAATLLRLCG